MAIAPPETTPIKPITPLATTYDPRTGPPSWYLEGGGSAPSQDIFQQQADIYREYLNRAGVRDPVTGGNTQTTAIGQQPTFGSVEPFWNTGTTAPTYPNGTMNTTGPGPQGATPDEIANWDFVNNRPKTAASTATNNTAAPATSAANANNTVAPSARTLVPNLSTIDPNNSLRTQQIMPGASSQLQGLQTSTYNAAQGLQGKQLGEFSPIAPGSYDTGTDAKRARELAMQSLEGLSNGPDRLQLALQAFNRYREEREPQYQQDVRGVGQKAAAFGRIGAGMTTNELTDLSTTRRRDEDRAQRSLIDDAVAQQLADRTMRLNAQLGAGGQFRGEDLATAGFQQGLRGEARGERADQAQQQLSQYGLDERGLDALLRTGQQFYGQEQGARDETRTERDFQDRLARYSVEDRIRQALMEEQFGNADFQRRLDQDRGALDWARLPTGSANPELRLR